MTTTRTEPVVAASTSLPPVMSDDTRELLHASIVDLLDPFLRADVIATNVLDAVSEQMKEIQARAYAAGVADAVISVEHVPECNDGCDADSHALVAEPEGLDLAVLARTNAQRCGRWHPPESEPWSLADWSNAMCGEAGEAANKVKKLRRIETRTDTGPWSHVVRSTGREVEHGRDDEARILAKGIGLELADVVIYADLLAQELTRKYGGYTLSELIATKFNAVSHREGFPERILLSYDAGGPAMPGQVLS